MTASTTQESIVGNLHRLAETAPDAIAITCGDESITRGELDRRSSRLARAYQERGVTPGSIVGILLPNSIEFLAAEIAVWKCGASPLPLSVQQPPRERDAIIALAEPSLVVGATEEQSAGFPSVPPGFEPESALSDDFVDAGAAAVWKVTMSGGSTGRPKLIVAEQPALRPTTEGFARLLGMSDDGTAVITGPLFHNAPFLSSICALTVGARVVLMPRFEAEETLRLIDRYRADWLYVVPTMMSRIARLPEEVRARYDIDSLNVVMHMAAPCPEWLKREWISWLGDRIWEVYAATEVQAVTLVTGEQWLEKPGTVGRPIIGELRILDGDGRAVEAGEVGELWMRRGPGLSAPYRYIGAEAKIGDDGWESVGDLGRIDEDGYLFLADRESDMFVVGGANVYPAEIENALSEHPLVRSAVVIGLPHEDLGSVPHALVELADEVSDDELREFLGERLTRYKIPRTFERVDGQIRDDAGKVRRAQLRAERVGG
ncbi:bile acid-coenzyme A ligase [Microbacterium sp. cf046]|uniref:AMP-binding protein n=1 Tax=Microbacterium sp. cf046 TaxID=1761803 RepID=UPI0008F36D85|nr:AMP-binding protein [Microbacterium sp. cf046]SFS14569.1 bile acid-coenzyme A ligase [Microbacterium sp. cf046]